MQVRIHCIVKKKMDTSTHSMFKCQIEYRTYAKVHKCISTQRNKYSFVDSVFRHAGTYVHTSQACVLV